MKGVTRVVLVDPLAEAGGELSGLLAGLGSIRVAEVCASFEDAVAAVERARPDLALIGLDADPGRAEALIRTLVDRHPGVAVLPASRSRDGDLILRTIRAGAREFLPLPADPGEVTGVVERLVQAAGGARGGDADGGSRILAVVGPSGGVGCTTLAVNLATTLARDTSREVALVDFDLLTGAVDVCLDLIPEQTLADVAQSLGRLDPTLLMRSLARHRTGLYVLPGPATLDDAAKIEPESLRPVLEMLRSVFPRVVVDLSKGLQLSDVMALEMADTVLMVVQLEPACLRNGARLLSLFRHFDGLVDRVRVVANRVGATPYEVGVKKAEALLKVPIGWQVVNDVKAFGSARSRGIPLELDASGCRAHRAIVEIARDFDPESGAERGRTRLGRFAASFF